MCFFFITCTMCRHCLFLSSKRSSFVFVVKREKNVFPIASRGTYSVFPFHSSMTLSPLPSQTLAYFTRCRVLYFMALSSRRRQTVAHVTWCRVLYVMTSSPTESNGIPLHAVPHRRASLTLRVPGTAQPHWTATSPCYPSLDHLLNEKKKRLRFAREVDVENGVC